MDEFKQKVRENWNVHAKDYDEQYQHGLKSAGEREAWMKLLAQLIPEKNARILDVGAGTGFLSLMLAQLGHQVKGVDLSPGMLDKAKKKAKTAKLANIEFAEGDAEALEEPSEKYDIVINRHLLWAMPNPKQAVSEWARVLKPGGRLLVLEFSKPILEPLSKAYDAYSFHVLPRIGELVANDAESYRYLAESIRMHPDQDTLKAMMQDAEFENVEYFNMTAGVVALHRGYKF